MVEWEKYDRLDCAASALMRLVDSAKTIAGDISENFFERINPDAISTDFFENRAKFRAVMLLLYEMEQELRKAGYSEQMEVDPHEKT